MKKLIFSIFMVFAAAGMSFAAIGYDAGSLNQQYVRDMRIHEFQTHAQNKNAIIQKEKAEEQGKVAAPTTIKTINNIRFSGNYAIPAGDLSRVVSSYIGKPATDTNISAVRKLVTKYYQANGYYSAIVVPDATSITTGLLTFNIQEGTKNSITIGQ